MDLVQLNFIKTLGSIVTRNMSFAPWGEKLIAPLFASQNVDYIREEKEEQNKNMVHSKSN